MTIKKNFLLIMILLIMIACVGCNTNSSEVEVKAFAASWKKDIEFIKKELPDRHTNLFFKMNQNDFEMRMDDLITSLPQMSEEEVWVELQKIMVALGDEHTGLNIPAKEMFPLDLMLFSDGWYVINTSSEYEEVLHCALVDINGHNIREVMEKLSKVIPHSNEFWQMAQMKYYIVLPQVLKGLNLIDDTSKVSFAFIDALGETHTLELEPQSGEKYFNEIIGNHKIQTDLPLYLKNSEAFYWYEVLEEERTLYFKYNSCRETEEEPFKETADEIMQMINNENIHKLVIDLRHNQGGDSSILSDFINQVAQSPLNTKEGIYVIIGRNTFSSAVLNAVHLKQNTNAFFVGEPTGGKPIHYGETNRFKLPESGASIRYSTKYFTRYYDGHTISPIEIEDDALYPDEVIFLSMEDYIKGKDPILDFIIKKGQ